jgi:WD40 repeat protein
VQRWPIQFEAAGPQCGLRTGTPHYILAPGSWQMGLSADGGTLGVVERSKGQALLLDLEGKTQPVVLPDHPGIYRIALSPDGRWAATGTRQGRGTRIWDTSSGKCLCELPGEDMLDKVQIAFTGNGQWLVTGTSRGYRFWEVGSWQPGPTIPADQQVDPRLALTRDDKVLALTPSPNRIRLVDVGTFRELATLQAPDTRNIDWLCFSRDGSLLAAACDNQVIQVWDLGHLRQELAARGLDW